MPIGGSEFQVFVLVIKKRRRKKEGCRLFSPFAYCGNATMITGVQASVWNSAFHPFDYISISFMGHIF